jgi:DNA mismatch repair protein MutL
VHPQKLEVRFARAQEVYAAVRHVVGAALARAPWLSRATPPAGRAYGAMATGVDEVGASAEGSLADVAAAAARGSGGDGGGHHAPVSGRSAPVLPFLPMRAPMRAADDASLDAFFTGLRYVGQVHRTYLVCEAPGELVLLDQHAAHERVAYSRLRKAHRARAVARQQLLFPLEVELDEATAATAARPEAAQVLTGLGFEWDSFGERRLVLRAVPELLKQADPRGLLLDALAGLGDDPAALAADEAIDHLLATLACHSVKRAGDTVTPAEAEALLASLDAVDLRGHCPHGRPVLVRLTLTELERRFGRA